MKKRSWYIWAAKPKFQTKKEIVSFLVFLLFIKNQSYFYIQKAKGGTPSAG